MAANQEVDAGQYVVIAVTDTGTGMTAEQIARAVEPFYTTKAVGRGTGLGLSMVFGFAKQSGGHFKLYSELGHGTTARLYLPRSAAAPAAVTVVSREVGKALGELILIVEDDASVRAAAIAALDGLGYRTEAAGDAGQALAMLRGGMRPDLLFTDVVMPGPVTARALSDEARAMYPGIAIVFTSGYTENSIVHAGQLDPGVTLIGKPWRVEELARRLRAALDGRRAAAPGRLRVLLVEDNELVRMTTADLIAGMGHEVAEAPTGELAMQALSVGTVDVMITDVGLPDMDGMTLLARARAVRPSLRVIVASGSAEPERLPDGLVWVVKPYDGVALTEALARVTAVPGA